MEAGKVVRLKSGGPAMTVLTTAGYGQPVICVWFDHRGRAQRENFPAATLEEVGKKDA